MAMDERIIVEEISIVTREDMVDSKGGGKEANLVTAKVPMEAVNSTDTGSVPKPQVIYRCKKCRRIVASQENIVSHKRGKGEECFKWRKRTVDLNNWEKDPAECSSIFVEPMKWMQAGRLGIVCTGDVLAVGSKVPLIQGQHMPDAHDYEFSCSTCRLCSARVLCHWPVEDGYVEEKLHCKGCNARLGSFNWAGMQCNCGAWVNPAFQLHKSRIDECCI